VVSPLARWQAEQGNLTVTNLRHEPVKLNDLPRQMLPLLDGTRDIDAITADVVKLAKNGKIGVRERDGGPVVTDDATLATVLRQSVEASLPDMVQVALLLE
jgi:methyltransferase-like protein